MWSTCKSFSKPVNLVLVQYMRFIMHADMIFLLTYRDLNFNNIATIPDGVFANFTNLLML